MKISHLMWLMAIIVSIPAVATAADTSVQTGFSYQSWTSNAHESGSQLHIPILLDGASDRFTWHATFGYASTSGELEGASDESVSGTLDSQVGGTCLLPKWGGLDWLLGLNLNLPTGQTGEDEKAVRIMIDPDLVSIVSPGQGFNINPGLSVARQWGAWTAGIGLGYAFQGQYDYSDRTRDYDPGDIFNMAGQVDYNFTPNWTLGLQVQYVTMEADRVDGDDLLRKGDAGLYGLTVGRAGASWDLELSVQGLFRGKAEVRDPDGALTTESRDSQGDEWIVGLDARYKLRPRTNLSTRLQYLYMDENGYERSSEFYMGSRQKVSLSLGLEQRLGDTIDLQFAVGGFVMDDNPNWLHPDEDRRYEGLSLTATISKYF